MIISSIWDKILRVLIFSRKIVTSLACYSHTKLPIQKKKEKKCFGHKYFIFQPIFNIFAAHFTTKLGLNIGKKIFFLMLNR